MKYQPPFGSTDPNAGWNDGNPSTGQEGSIPSAKSFEEPLRELSNAIAGTGLTPTDNDLTQLLQAISTGIYVGTFTGTANALSATLPGSVSPALLLEGMSVIGYVGGSTNSAATTFNLSGFLTNPGAKPLVRRDGTSAFAQGDLPANALVTFRYDGTRWRYRGWTASDLIPLIAANSPIYLAASQDYYVNASTGSDNNNGLTSGTAFATLQKAVNTVARFNLNGFSITIHVADGTYAPVSLLPVAGSGSVPIIGNSATPFNCLIDGTALAKSCITASNCGAAYSFNGFRVKCNGVYASDPMAGLLASGGGTSVTLTNFNFASCGGAHIFAAQGALIALAGALSISGGCAGNAQLDGSHMSVQNSGAIQGSTNQPSMTISSAVGIAGSFAKADTQSSIQVIYSSITNPGNVTSGKRYTSNNYSIINTGGGGANYYPGATAGTVSNGLYL